MSEETAPKVRTKKSANYALEQMLDGAERGGPLWLEVKDGFVSPEKALDHAKEQKLQGAFRVVRVASPVYGGSVVQQEPIYTLKKIDSEDKPKTKKTKTPKEKSAAPAAPAAPKAILVPVPPPVEKAALPPEVLEALPPDEGENPGEDADATP